MSKFSLGGWKMRNGEKALVSAVDDKYLYGYIGLNYASWTLNGVYTGNFGDDYDLIEPWEGNFALETTFDHGKTEDLTRLRDEFAMAALPALIAAVKHPELVDWKNLAEDAYDLANAAMEARK